IAAGMPVRPARDVAGREDAGRGRLEMCIDEHPAIEVEARGVREFDARVDADAGHHEIGLEHRAALQLHLPAVDDGCGVWEVKHDAVLMMERLHESAELGPKDA